MALGGSGPVPAAARRPRNPMHRATPAMLAGLAMLAAPAPGGAAADGVALTLDAAIEQALQANPTLVDARLDRELQRSEAADAERLFTPQWRLGTALDGAHDDARAGSTAAASVFPSVELDLTTGGQLTLRPEWTRRAARDGTTQESTALTLALAQPLGRGAGSAVATAPLARARLAEESHALAFRGTVMRVVTDVVDAYRTLIRAGLEVTIRERSLADAKRTRDVVAVLIETGRVAESDRIQTETDVSEREIRLVESALALEDAEAALAVLLGLEAGQRVRPVDALPDLAEGAALEAELAGSLERALAGEPGYLQAGIAERQAALERLVARDTLRPELSLRAEASFAGDGDGPGASLDSLADGLATHGRYAVGVQLSMPLGGLERRREERTRQRAEVAHAKAGRALDARRRELEIEIRRAAERVRAGHRQVRLAADALALAREQVRIEEGKLRLGLTSTYHMGRVRSRLADAETFEVNARIDYLRARSALDLAEGAVLDRWDVAPPAPGAGAPALPATAP